MNQKIIKEICQDLMIKPHQVEAVLKLLEEGNTIPFIARYRKEATSFLDEEMIKNIADKYQYQVNLANRKEEVIRLIFEKGLLTEELKKQIENCEKLIEVDDIYRPYKEKKETKATKAIKQGLEPLAKKIMSFPKTGNIHLLVQPYIKGEITTETEAIDGAKYIIAEWISDNAFYRKWIRRQGYLSGLISSKKRPEAIDDDLTYQMYYNYQEKISTIKAHRVLAVNRGEKEKVLTVSLEVDDELMLQYLRRKIIKEPTSFTVDIVNEAIKDSYKRLIWPSIKREIRSELKDKAEEVAINNFAKNLEKLLLVPPIKEKVVLALDPAFRTGCKLAVLDKTGKVLDIAVIYPVEPKCEVEQSRKVVLDLIDKYQVDIIAIGNGTASRESEQFIADTIKEAKRKVEYIIVSEAGASVYSASKLAIQEFPNLTLEKRSAVSIGRRLQDALAELVKIDPKSIGVGLYQHDVTPKKLENTLDFVVTKVVNQVGVNINTASASILKYVSGLTNKAIEAILKFRDEHGIINSREEIKGIKGLSNKQYEQAIGFMRIIDGSNPLDKTDIHPESYEVTKKLLLQINCSVNDIGTIKLKDKIKDLDLVNYSKILDVSSYTLEDILLSLEKPNRDPRDDMPKPILRSDILQLMDLHVGDKLQGTVRNVAPFGAFVDVGLHDDGLVHISKLSKQYIADPQEVVNVGDIVDCYVIDIDLKTKRLALSLLPPNA